MGNNALRIYSGCENYPQQLCNTMYIRLQRWFMYLMAITDWFSQYELPWEVSIMLDTSFYLETLDQALCITTLEIFNNDQGMQFNDCKFTSRLNAADIRISWDGRWQAWDNIFVERMWHRSISEIILIDNMLYKHIKVHNYDSPQLSMT